MTYGDYTLAAYNRVPITVETREKFREISKRERRSMNAMIALLIEIAIEEYEDEHGVISLPEEEE